MHACYSLQEKLIIVNGTSFFCKCQYTFYILFCISSFTLLNLADEIIQFFNIRTEVNIIFRENNCIYKGR